MSAEAVIAEKSPFAVALVEGETYYWCVCGRSKSQPFCDGSHQGTGLELLHLQECEREIHEGRFHTGLGAVVRLAGRKSSVVAPL